MPHLQIEIHVLHPSPSAESKAKGYLLPDFYSGAAGIPGRFSEGLLLRRLQMGKLRLKMKLRQYSIWAMA
jgi:hypothetical protein